MKAYIISFLVETILPRLLSWAAEVIPSLAESAVQDIIQKIKEKKAGINMPASVKITTVNKVDNTALGNVPISYSGAVSSSTTSDETGSTSISGLPAGDYTFTAKKDGYADSSEKISLVDGGSADITIGLVSANTQEVVQSVEAKVVEAATPVIATAIAVTTTNCTNITDAKTAYKALEASVSNSKAAITEAMATGATEIVQSEGASLVVTLKSQLTDSIAWYVKQRSELGSATEILTNPKKFAMWCDYSSMIGAMYLMRSNLMTYIDEIITWAMNHVK